MELEKKSGKSGYGGARPGAGRPKGSGTKLTVEKLLQQIDSTLGCSLEEKIAANYAQAQGDPKLAFQYEQLFLNKVMADRQQVEIDDTSTVDNRQTAFLKALEVIGNVAVDHDSDTTDK